METERLLERGATVSLFSLVMAGSEEEGGEEEEAGELSKGEIRSDKSHLGHFPIFQKKTSVLESTCLCPELCTLLD